MQALIHTAAFVLTLVIGFCLVAFQEFPLLHDYPEWMFQGWIFQQLLTAENATIAEQYALVQYPVPNSLSQAVLGALNFVTTPLLAGRLWLGFYLLLSSMLWFVVARRNKDALQHLLLTALVTLGPGFWNGYINFQFALLWFAIYLYLNMYRHKHSAVLLFVFSLLIFLSHAVVFAIFVTYCLARALFNRVGSISLPGTVAALLPSLVLLGWYAVMKLTDNESRTAAGMGLTEWLQYKVYTVAKQGPFHNFILHNGESYLQNSDILYKAGFIANFLVVVLLVVWSCYLIWGYYTQGAAKVLRIRSRGSTAILICLALCFVVFMLSGVNSFGVVNLGERFLVIMLLVLLLLFVCPPSIQYSLATLSVVFMVLACVATVHLSMQNLQDYSVASSSSEQSIERYVDDIYANSRHKYFNHRLFIYADRGRQLAMLAAEIDVSDLVIDLETSIISRK